MQFKYWEYEIESEYEFESERKFDKILMFNLHQSIAGKGLYG